MNRCRILLLILALLTLISQPSAISLAEPEAPITPLLSTEGEEPVLSLSRQANFREEGVRSGTLYEIYADRSLAIYALGMLEDADEPVLMHAGSVTEAEYLAVEQMLIDGDFLSLPEWIETGVLDGDAVTLTARTNEGEHTVSAYSPDGTPFGDIASGIESLLGVYETATDE